MKGDRLEIWVIYDNAFDLPGCFSARKWEVLPGFLTPCPTGEFRTADTLNELQDDFLNRGLYRLSRNSSDEPHIVESWL